MKDVDILPPPDLSPPPSVPTKFEREKAAFHRLLPMLLPSHRNQYVAIHNEQVVESGPDLVQVALAAYERFGYQAIYVDLVTDEPAPPVRIPHFDIVSPRLPA